MLYISSLIFLAIITITFISVIYNIVVPNIIFALVLFALYYSINIFVILKMGKTKGGSISIVLLSIQYLLCSITESFWFALMLIFLLIYLYIRNYNVPTTIAASVISVICLTLFLLNLLMPITEVERDRVYNSNKSIAIIAVYSDMGATGSAIAYQAEAKIIPGHLYIRKKIALGNKLFIGQDDKGNVEWIDNDTCIIEDGKYKVKFP